METMFDHGTRIDDVSAFCKVVCKKCVYFQSTLFRFRLLSKGRLPFMHDAEMQQNRDESNVNPRSKGRRGTGQRKIAVAYDTATV